MIDTLLGAATTAAMTALGYWAGRRERKARQPPGPICPCGHAINFHKGLTGKCSFTWMKTTLMSLGPQEWRCDCQIYAGPELISTFTGRPVVERGVIRGEQP